MAIKIEILHNDILNIKSNVAEVKDLLVKMGDNIADNRNEITAVKASLLTSKYIIGIGLTILGLGITILMAFK